MAPVVALEQVVVVVVVLGQSPWEGCSVQECLNYDQLETALLEGQHCSHLAHAQQYPVSQVIPSWMDLHVVVKEIVLQLLSSRETIDPYRQTLPNHLMSTQNLAALLHLHLRHSIAVATVDPPQTNRVLGLPLRVVTNTFHLHIQARGGLLRHHLLPVTDLLDTPQDLLAPLHPQSPPVLPHPHLPTDSHLMFPMVS